jgi:hypothetical protein
MTVDGRIIRRSALQTCDEVESCSQCKVVVNGGWVHTPYQAHKRHHCVDEGGEDGAEIRPSACKHTSH